MKKRGVILAILGVLLLTACGQTASNYGEENSDSGAVLPATETGDLVLEEEADFYDRVFDTTQDEGKLTARYLYLRETYGTGEDMVTTGDSAVYTSPEGLVMLVDCGNIAGGQEVSCQLEEMGVEKLDFVVLSHPHADHVGGFCTIAENFSIGQIYWNGHEYDSQTYRDMMEMIEKLEIPCQVLKDGDVIPFGEQVQIQVFGPVEGDTDLVAGGYQDANDGSIAMRLTYGESSFWTSGDLYIPGEQGLMQRYGGDIQSDIVKMNHHGKDTSNHKDYIQTIAPKVAVGMFDSIGSQTVAMRYVAAGVQVYYTCTDGAVRISTTGDGSYEIQTQKVRDAAALPEPALDGYYVITKKSEYPD